MSDPRSVNVTWQPPETPRTQKKADPTSLQPVVRAIVNGGAQPSYDLTPLAADPDQPGARGTAVFVPTIDYYFCLIYLSGENGPDPTSIALPNVVGILIIDLPKGIYTSADEINEAIEGGTGGGDPGTVGPSSPH